jgi:hypothetical protein
MDETTEIMATGDPKFFSLLSELAELHSIKAQAYGLHNADDLGFIDDPLANARYASPDFGVEPWVYALIRANEKMRRLQAYVLTDDQAEENVRDSFLDLASQALIGLIMWEEAMEEDSIAAELLDELEDEDDD